MPMILDVGDIKAAIKAIRNDLVVNPTPDRIREAREFAVATFNTSDTDTARTEICTILALHYHNFADFNLAYEWLDKGRSFALNDPNSSARLAYTHAAMLYRERRAREALSIIEPLLAPGSDPVIDTSVLARLQSLLAGILDSLGMIDEADQAFRTALDLRERLGNKLGLATVYFNYGEFCLRRDDEERALEFFLKSYDIERDSRNEVGLAQTACHLAIIYARRKDDQTALQYLSNARVAANAAGVPMTVALVKINAAEVFELLGDQTSQLTALLDSKTYLDRYSFQSLRGQVLGSLAELYVGWGAFEKAEPLLDEAITISEAEEHLYVLGYWLFIKGRMRNLQGRYAEAIPLLVRARDMLASVQAHVYALRAFSELANAQSNLGATSEGFRTMAEWASSYITQHHEDVETRMRRVQRIRDQERKAQEDEIYRLRNVELSAANSKLAEVNNQLEQTNDIIRRANKDLTELASEKDEFMAIAAHDLRNPLAEMRSMLKTVTGHFEIVSRDDMFDVCRELLTVVTRMESTIHSFLEISRTDKRSAGLNIDRLDLVRFAHRAAERHFTPADSKDIAIYISADEKSVWGMGDPSIVDAILDNLISNAIKFSPRSTIVTIHVSTVGLESVVHVLDKGPGIPESEQQSLFKKYTRLSTQPTGGEESIGLGLYLAKRMAERMKGTIDYETNPEGGSMFTLRMPSSNDN